MKINPRGKIVGSLTWYRHINLSEYTGKIHISIADGKGIAALIGDDYTQKRFPIGKNIVKAIG